MTGRRREQHTKKQKDRGKSIANIDANATDQASADQSVKDAAAKKSASPADQGGQG